VCLFWGKAASFAQEISESPWMSLPFMSSGCAGAVLACAIKVAGCATPFWPLFQATFASCTAVHSALISPLQSLPTKRTTYQSVIKSTLQIAWALRAGVINALLIDLLKHLSVALFGQNRYLLCFWDIVSIVTILPVIANPICSLATGMLIVGGVAAVSLATKYIGDKVHTIHSQQHTETVPKPHRDLCAGREPQAEPQPFFDSESRQYYFRPPSGRELNELIEKYQVQGEYPGMAMGRRKRIRNLRQPEQSKQPCDVLTLTKTSDQIAFEKDEKRRRDERKSLLSIFFEQLENIRNRFALELLPVKSFRERMQNRIKKQETLANQLAAQLDSLLRTTWQNAYSSFLICGERELRQLGYSDDQAQKIHALVLFYKPLPREEPHS
jgi:hypothetical protein